MASPEARLINHSHTITRTAAAEMTPGTIVEEAGLPGIILGSGKIPIGENYEIALDVIVDVPAASATTFAEGADVFFNTSTRLAVTAAGANVIWLGVADVAKVNGQTKVKTIFNKRSNASLVALIAAETA